jgi:hypothetical protein
MRPWIQLVLWWLTCEHIQNGPRDIWWRMKKDIRRIVHLIATFGSQMYSASVSFDAIWGNRALSTALLCISSYGKRDIGEIVHLIANPLIGRSYICIIII